MFIALAFAQAASEVEAATMETQQSLLSMMLNSNFAIQLDLLALIFFSVVSWAIIGSKSRQIKKAKARSDGFFEMFWRAPSIEDMLSNKTFKKSPALNVFKAGIEALRETGHHDKATVVQKEIRRAAENEVEILEAGVPFLATTSTVSPFLGLFGTVWGIIYAFWVIGRTGYSSFTSISPHMAEALVTTAIGLVAAIPAIIFYNYFTNKIRIISKSIFDFSDDLYYRIEKEYLAKGKS